MVTGGRNADKEFTTEEAEGHGEVEFHEFLRGSSFYSESSLKFKQECLQLGECLYAPFVLEGWGIATLPSMSKYGDDIGAFATPLNRYFHSWLACS